MWQGTNGDYLPIARLIWCFSILALTIKARDKAEVQSAQNFDFAHADNPSRLTNKKHPRNKSNNIIISKEFENDYLKNKACLWEPTYPSSSLELWQRLAKQRRRKTFDTIFNRIGPHSIYKRYFYWLPELRGDEEHWTNYCFENIPSREETCSTYICYWPAGRSV